MKARKLKIYIKTGKFSFPIPALRFSTLKWLSKMIIKCCQSKMIAQRLPQSSEYENILKNITCKDIDQIIDQLKQEEPFEMVDIETYDENEEKVVVKIYTL